METPDDAHTAAADAFVRHVESLELSGIESLTLFGSTARGEASGLDSDVDFLAVVADDADQSALEDTLRDVAYDVMLEHGPVVEVHVLTQSAFEERRDHPFVTQTLRDGERYV